MCRCAASGSGTTKRDGARGHFYIYPAVFVSLNLHGNCTKTESPPKAHVDVCSGEAHQEPSQGRRGLKGISAVRVQWLGAGAAELLVCPTGIFTRTFIKQNQPKYARPLRLSRHTASSQFGTGRGRSDNKNISPLSAPRATDGCRDPGDVPPLRPMQQRVATGVAVPAGGGRFQVATSPANAARGTGHRPRARRRGRVRRHVRGWFRGCQRGSIELKHVWFITQDFKLSQRSGVQNIINYFTYKGTHTVLHQLYEMNPPSYTWLYK
jgi:hypothetical protein